MPLKKSKTDFENAANSRKVIFDKAVKFYNSKSFQWTEYPNDSKSNAIGKIKLAVYAFIVKNPSKHVNKILEAVDRQKKTEENNKLPKVNDDCAVQFKKNGCLYIGSVTSESLQRRIKQHWRLERNGNKGNGTFALKINDWIGATDLDEKDITVYYCNMTSQEKENQEKTSQQKELVRVIEDCLATMYHPLLGKRGDSPKG